MNIIFKCFQLLGLSANYNASAPLSTTPLRWSDYVIIGSGILGVRGFAEIKDLDVLVTEAAFERLKLIYNLEEEVSHLGSRKLSLKMGAAEYEFFIEDGFGNSVVKYLSNASLTDGICFASISDTLDWYRKLADKLKRDKDYRHIEMLESLEH